MSKLDERSVRKMFSEVVGGYSLAKLRSEFVFIKHFSPIDSLEFDFRYDESFKEAVARGIPTEDEKVELLIKSGLWPQNSEEDIARLRETLTSLHQNKRNHYAPRDIESFNIQIKDHETALIGLLQDRARAVGSCAESMARRKIDMAQIFNSFYKENDLKNKVFTEEYTDSLERDEVEELLTIYNQIVFSLSDENMRKVAISRDFQQMFSLTDNLYEFYGTPIAKLTNYQISLASYGGHFRQILGGEQRPPQSVIDDPEKLEDWFYSRNNFLKVIEKDEAEGVTTGVFGVTKKDLELWGIDTGQSSKKSIGKAARERGGMITAEEMMNEGLV